MNHKCTSRTPAGWRKEKEKGNGRLGTAKDACLCLQFNLLRPLFDYSAESLTASTIKYRHHQPTPPPPTPPPPPPHPPTCGDVCRYSCWYASHCQTKNGERHRGSMHAARAFHGRYMALNRDGIGGTSVNFAPRSRLAPPCSPLLVCPLPLAARPAHTTRPSGIKACCAPSPNPRHAHTPYIGAHGWLRTMANALHYAGTDWKS